MADSLGYVYYRLVPGDYIPVRIRNEQEWADAVDINNRNIDKKIVFRDTFFGNGQAVVIKIIMEHRSLDDIVFQFNCILQDIYPVRASFDPDILGWIALRGIYLILHANFPFHGLDPSSEESSDD